MSSARLGQKIGRMTVNYAASSPMQGSFRASARLSTNATSIRPGSFLDEHADGGQRKRRRVVGHVHNKSGDHRARTVTDKGKGKTHRENQKNCHPVTPEL